MQSLLRPFSGALRHNRIGRAGTPLPAAIRRATECVPYLLFRSRARKGADGRIPAKKPGQHDPHRRAVDCAPYLNSAFFRPCGKNADVWSRAPLPMQQNFFERGPRRPVGVAVQLLLCYGARRSWLRVFCDRDGRAPLGGLERGHPGRSACW